MVDLQEELGSLIQACEAAAQAHIAYARRAHTEFHERRAAEALQTAHKYRQELRVSLEE
jgi:hypothetical protein